MILRLVIGVVYFLIAYKLNNFKDWKSYYSTIEFWIIGHLIATFITYNYPLWELTSPGGKVTFNELIFSLFVFPPAGLLFLTNFPENKNLLRRSFYTILWILYFSGLELALSLIGYLKYSHGWNIIWSIVFNFCMFPLIRVHYKHPPWAWGFASLIGAGIIYYFKIPVSSMK